MKLKFHLHLRSLKRARYMKKIFLILISTLLLLPLIALAIEFQNPLQYDTFGELVDAIMNFIFVLAIVAAPLVIIIGALQLLTSGGDPKKTGAGKNMITYALIGLAIILLARGLIAMIQQAIGVQ